jgi:hypothetical protein
VKVACELAQASHRLGESLTLLEVLSFSNNQHPEHLEFGWYPSDAACNISAYQPNHSRAIVYKVCGKLTARSKS